MATPEFDLAVIGGGAGALSMSTLGALALLGLLALVPVFVRRRWSQPTPGT